MEFRQLRAFVTLAECLSYREAADKLWLTQPTLTKQIKLFEQELALTLFIRDNHGTQLSPQGQALYDRAKNLLMEIDKFKAHCKNIKLGQEGNLSIGFINAVSKLMPGIISSFLESHPSVNIQLTDNSSPLQKELIIAGKMHAGFMRLPVEPPLEYKKISEDGLALIYSKQLDSAYQDMKSLVKKYPLLLVDTKTCPGSAHQIHNFILHNQLNKIPTYIVNNASSLLAMAEAKIGLGILPQSSIPPENPDLVCERLTGDYANWDIGLVWNPDINDPVRDSFIHKTIEEFSLSNQR
ncbi:MULTISPECIES: LysR family transcriptional regulator [unclassified Brenneria]|uniref:LysR family transcriptional regulator n=1 Tax=unclassified Brenneria TaxID=2634434 RepID=UPI0029C33964|nr:MULTISPECIES: LysR family transcriptional regulator [unclassified Brenneria]MDX5627542.1 LysR family transcriptional regulator [Brenneria sp. L3-3Z]MDX5694302.1 LysR family transcriptional regulator [Brenneria sp. L4-2C]MEE3662115.1 LysR family transcriptional regulator [Brenneria sp. g21c3]